MTVQTLSRPDGDRLDRVRVAAPDRPSAPQPIAMERSVYRPRGLDPVSAIAALLLAAGGFASFQLLGFHPHVRHEHRLTVISLMDLQKPPPPPAAPVPKDQPHPTVQPEIVVPPAIVALPAPPATVAVTNTPAPPQPAPAPPAAAVAQAAPAPPSAPPADAGDLSSKMISATPPTYPEDSRRLHEQGTVTLAVLLSIDGRVDRVSVAKSSGFYRLDRAATAAVRHWRWSPTVRDGQPVLVQGNVVIPFVLRG